MTVTIVLLPGPGSPRAAVEHATGFGDVQVVDASDSSWPTRVRGDLVAPLRAGDRMLPARLGAQRRALEASGAVLALGSYRVVTSAGDLVDEVHATGWSSLAVTVVYDIPEPSSILVKRTALLSTLEHPRPDALVPAALLAARHGAAAVDDVVAEVTLDDSTAGADDGCRSWFPILRDLELSRQPHASAVRRDLLARLYLDPLRARWRAVRDEHLWEAERTGHDDGIEAPSDSGGPVDDAAIRDLRWALDRQAELLASMQVRWARELGDEDRVGPFPDREIAMRDDEIATLHREVAERDALVEKLRRAVAERDERVSALGSTDARGSVGSSRARALARRVVPEPIRRRLRR